MDDRPTDKELESLTGLGNVSARKLALDILEETLVPAAEKIKAMICDQDEISRAKFDTCKWVIELFFGSRGVARKSDAIDWESALARISIVEE